MDAYGITQGSNRIIEETPPFLLSMPTALTAEKAGEASVEFIIPRHKCRGNAKH